MWILDSRSFAGNSTANYEGRLHNEQLGNPVATNFFRYNRVGAFALQPCDFLIENEMRTTWYVKSYTFSLKASGHYRLQPQHKSPFLTKNLSF